MRDNGSISEKGGFVQSNPPPPLGRDRVGRYEVIYPIASGGMASVYVGRLSGMAGFERLVAIKIIHSHLAAEDAFVKMFLDEARLAARIHHPNVGEIIEVGEDDGLFYMIGELIFGQSLRAFIRRAKQKRIEISNALFADIASQVCRALHCAHELRGIEGELLGLVHRDVSPRNILISYDGFVKLIDFGVAFAQGRVSHTEVGTLKGKIGYMSPEQIRSKPFDRRSDLFSLGVVIYQMITGRQPFMGNTDIDRLNKILEYKFVRPRNIVRELDPDLERIILTSMARSPGGRYPTAAAMGEALDAFVRKEAKEVGAPFLSNLMHDLFSKEYAFHQEQLRKYRRDDKTPIETLPKFKTKKAKASSSNESSTLEATKVGTPGSKRKARTEEQRKKLRIAILVATVAVLIGGIATFINFIGKTEPAVSAKATEKSDATPIPTPKESIAPEAADTPSPEIHHERKEVRVRLDIQPKGAMITLDGKEFGSDLGSLSIPADGNTHTIEVSQDGYTTQKINFIADEDRVVTATLLPEPKPPMTDPKKKRIKTKKKKDSFSLRKSPY
ncbi:MAG: protein kinase [Myxococcota bacterium]|nr:protein kinase [Myxococcota bacterium]